MTIHPRISAVYFDGFIDLAMSIGIAFYESEAFDLCLDTGIIVKDYLRDDEGNALDSFYRFDEKTIREHLEACCPGCGVLAVEFHHGNDSLNGGISAEFSCPRFMLEEAFSDEI